ncbi:hypothetical protein ACWGOE_01990 [Leucobacter chromiiresistens]|uniref:Uncharacterized protein n=1 Tax=Leucobacter chromiiresistens TaxID=1079994 RepID=A0A1H1BF98_9MICO|nr:hypothetical protein [Leucobacter chromiiresistens]SDQ50628.1 hypothetical protein SAMN04488565_2787 [Leucobacter chromiiresistens]
MTPEPRRGVTRGYVAGLVGAAIVVATALLVAVWGGLALLLGRDPVESGDVVSWAAPLILFGGLALLAVLLWRQAITLLRGRREPAWSSLVGAAAGIYLWWGVLGMLAGMTVGETWLSPFAAALPVIWAAAALLFWAVLARRVYTDRPAPRWPWERDEDEE